MKGKRQAFFIALVLVVCGPVFASQIDNVRIRLVAAMEPIGLMNSLKVSYGFSPGLEVYMPIGNRLEMGLGFQWQVQRRLVSTSPTDGIPDDAWFSYKPLYLAARIHITRLEDVRLHAVLKAGFNFFEADTAFGEAWAAPLTDFTGGLYAGAGLGVSIALIQRAAWNWDFSMETGYSYHGATGTDGIRNRSLSYQVLVADLGFDWRF